MRLSRHFALLWLLAATTIAAPPRFELQLDASVCEKPYSGRVFIMLTRSERRDPVHGPDWFGNDPFFSQDVNGWKPGDTLKIDADKTLGHPIKLADLPAGKYRAQASIDLNGWSHEVVDAPGNAISEAVAFEHDPTKPAVVELKLSKRLPEPKLADSPTLKFVKLQSKLLTEFHKRDVSLRAAVALPPDYAADAKRKFPTVYMIPGFGGTIAQGRFAQGMANFFSDNNFEAVVVYLDPDCPTGHHVFADSANNGPWGKALTAELIPFIEREYRVIPESGARFVTGHSSGGWSSLWLQVTYPDIFGGVWSTSPDPVDFTAFQTIDIHDGKLNFYEMPDGSPRPIARPAGRRAALSARSFCSMENVLGRGGQMYSFCAVFGPRGDDGKPVMLWDWQTGKLDEKVAEYWRRYDIRATIEREWSTLGPKLAGKLHLFCGDTDDFYLDAAFLKLSDTLHKLGSDAYVEVVPGAGHGLPPAVQITCVEQMKKLFESRYSGKQ